MFDFQLSFEFAMRTMGHQNTTINFQLFRVCYENNGPSCGPVFSQEVQGKNQNKFWILTTWPSVLIVLLSDGLWHCKKCMPAANLVVYRGYVRLHFFVFLGKTAIIIIQLISCLIGATLWLIVLIPRATYRRAESCVLFGEVAWNWWPRIHSRRLQNRTSRPSGQCSLLFES